MTKFKAGDKVVRTEAYTWQDVGGFMQVGKEYTVVEASEEALVLKGDFNNVRYDPDMFKLVKPAFKNMKFRVSSPEHSKEIQEALFEMGYAWECHEAIVQYEFSNFLTSWDDGTLGYGEHAYNKNVGNEFTLQTTKSYKISPKPEVITIDGKTYDKEAVLKRLAELEAIQD